MSGHGLPSRVTSEIRRVDTSIVAAVVVSDACEVIDKNKDDHCDRHEGAGVHDRDDVGIVPPIQDQGFASPVIPQFVWRPGRSRTYAACGMRR